MAGIRFPVGKKMSQRKRSSVYILDSCGAGKEADYEDGYSSSSRMVSSMIWEQSIWHKKGIAIGYKRRGNAFLQSLCEAEAIYIFSLLGIKECNSE